MANQNQAEKIAMSAYNRVNALTADLAKEWQTWIPILTWVGAIPVGVITNSKYKIVGSICYISMYITATNGNNATGLTITNLPVPPKANNVRPIMTSKLVSGTVIQGTRGAIVVDDGVANSIGWPDSDMLTAAAGSNMKLYLSGFYEIGG